MHMHLSWAVTHWLVLQAAEQLKQRLFGEIESECGERAKKLGDQLTSLRTLLGTIDASLVVADKAEKLPDDGPGQPCGFFCDSE